MPGDLRQQIDAFVEHYSHRRHHASLQNLTPADVYFGRGETILKQRERIKRKTIETWRLLHRKSAAYSQQTDEPDPPLVQAAICPKNPDDGHITQDPKSSRTMEHDRTAGRKDYFPRFGGLKSFFAVASTGSAVRAAERLNVSASSVSHQVKALETELGVRLVENRKGKLVLTPDGARYFDQIKGPMLQILQATETIRSMPGRKRVSLTLTPSFAVGWLMPRLIDLERAHPDLEVSLVTTTRVVDLERENVDLAIRRGSGQWDGYVVEELLEEEAVPVVSPRFLEENESQSLEDMLKRIRVLVNTTVEHEWDIWCAARGLTAPDAAARYNLETYELTVQAARDGLGVALGRKPLIDPLLASAELVQPFPVSKAGNASYFVVRQPRAMRSDTRRLHDWLLAQAS